LKIVDIRAVANLTRIFSRSVIYQISRE